MDRDRFSELPDYILHRILSFLEPPEERHRWYPELDYHKIPNNHEAARAACLSKSWLGVCLTYPNLTFYFDPDNPERMEKIERYVENTISRFSKSELFVHSLTIVGPRLYSYGKPCLDSSLPSLILKSIGFAVENHVKILRVDCSKAGLFYRLPDAIFGAKSLIELKLRSFYCRGLFPDTKIELTNLKKVIFEKVILQDDWKLDKLLFSNCPLIEEIELFHCSVPFKRVSNVPKLKRFMMLSCIGCQVVEIDAPSLESFYFVGDYKGDWNINLDACPCLKRLALRTNLFTVKNISFSKFMYLEDLELGNFRALLGKESLNISSQSLKRLRLIMDPEAKWEVMIDAPNLLQLRNGGYRLKCLSFQNPPKELMLRLHMPSDVTGSSSTWFLEFKKFLMEHLNQTKIYLILVVNDFIQTGFEIQEDLQELPLEHLALCLFSGKINHQALVDGLLWSCHPRYISVRWVGVKPDCKLIEYLLDNVMNRGGSIILNSCDSPQFGDAKVGSSNGKSCDAYKTVDEGMKAAEESKIVYFKL